MYIEFGLLGEVYARGNGRAIDLGHARPQCVLTVLLVDANHSVPLDQLVDRVWGVDAPQQAPATVRSYVSRLRSALPAAAECGIERRAGGYVLEVEEDAVDLHRFRRLVGRARAAGEDAVALYEQALGLWRGEPFAGLDAPWLAAMRETLRAERFAARLDYHDLRLRRGEEATLLTDLLDLAAEHPLDERLAGQLVLALYRSGRQAEALQRYDQLRRRLAEEVGADPKPELQRLHQQILTADSTLTASATRSVPVPRQLPPSPLLFSGRVAELSGLDRALGTDTQGADDEAERDVDENESVGTIATIGGSGGVGKTWLALHWAHEHLDSFPDGQLHVNLRGFEPTESPMPAGVAVRAFLDALGVEPATIPAGDVEAQAALFRSLVVDRRMLIVLDNARSTAQVAPLIPAGSPCVVLVTSRHQLAGLVTGHGAHPISLDVLDATEGRRLLTRHIGPRRIEAEPEAAAELQDHCAGLPLALGIVAARTKLRPSVSLTALAEELREDSARLDALDGGESVADVRSVFSWSYSALSGDEARLFRLLGIHPGPDSTPDAVAALADVPVARAKQALERLASAHLIQRQTAQRYTVHDLIRLYAADRARIEETREEREAGLRRLGGWYVHSAHAAALLLGSFWVRSHEPPPAEGRYATPVSFGSRAQAIRWLEAEQDGIIAVIGHAAEHGPVRSAYFLAESLHGYFWRNKRLDDWLTVARYGLAAADADGDTKARAVARFSLANVHTHRNQHKPSVALFAEALSLAERADWADGQAAILRGLAAAHWRTGLLHDAAKYLSQGLDLSRRTGSRVGIRTSLHNLGIVHHELGRLHRALAYFTEALALETSQHRAITLQELASVHHGLGDFTAAIDHVQQALPLARELGDYGTEVDCQCVLGAVHRDTGRVDQANEAAESALAESRTMGDPLLEANALNLLGTVHNTFRQHALAAEHHGQARDTARTGGNRHPETAALIGLAHAARGRGQVRDALAYAEDAVALARAHSFTELEGHALTALAEGHLANGVPTRAVEEAHRSAAIQQDTGHRLGQARALYVLGSALQTLEGHGAALIHWKSALRLFNDIGSPQADEVRTLLIGRTAEG